MEKGLFGFGVAMAFMNIPLLEKVKARNALRGTSRPYVCQRTDRRRIEADAAAMTTNRTGVQTMKRNIHRSRKSPGVPIAWRQAEYAALRANAADTCDDRVSENIFDVEDERAEVDIIIHAMTHDAN
jgi:hypothetical protein